MVVDHYYVHESASERSRGPWWWEKEVTGHICHYCVPCRLFVSNRSMHPLRRSLFCSFVCVVVDVVVVIHDYSLWQSSLVRPVPYSGGVVRCESHSHFWKVKQRFQLAVQLEER